MLQAYLSPGALIPKQSRSFLDEGCSTEPASSTYPLVTRAGLLRELDSCGLASVPPPTSCLAAARWWLTLDSCAPESQRKLSGDGCLKGRPTESYPLHSPGLLRLSTGLLRITFQANSTGYE